MKKKVILVISAVLLFIVAVACYIVRDDLIFLYQLNTDREVFEKSIIRPDYHLDNEHLAESPKEAYSDVMLTYFNFTGVTVLSFDNFSFDIYEDGYGRLYYYDELYIEPVLDGDGNILKDISVLEDCDIVFTYSGVSVKNSRGHRYDVLKDKYGWLYYSSQAWRGRTLTPVVDSDGNKTKDLSVFNIEN